VLAEEVSGFPGHLTGVLYLSWGLWVWVFSVLDALFFYACLRCWCFFWFPQQERKVFSRRRTVLPQCSEDHLAEVSILLRRTLLVYQEVPRLVRGVQVH